MDLNRAAQVAISWADAEGWNPGLDDAERFLAADPHSFLATEHEDEIVATVSCALYGDSYAFIGFYIVRSDVRGRGVGRTLFERALERAGGRVVGLDGVLAQQGSYERRGFVLAHRNVRWRTVGGGERPEGVVELSSVPIQQLLAFDTAVFGSERERFLRVWIDRPAGQALACLDGGRLAGYGVLRPCHVGAKIGPLFAEDADVADALRRRCLERVALAAGDACGFSDGGQAAGPPRGRGLGRARAVRRRQAAQAVRSAGAARARGGLRGRARGGGVGRRAARRRRTGPSEADLAFAPAARRRRSAGAPSAAGLCAGRRPPGDRFAAVRGVVAPREGRAWSRRSGARGHRSADGAGAMPGGAAGRLPLR